MQFKEALRQVRNIANGRYCSVSYELTTFSKESDHPDETRVRVYVDPGPAPGVSVSASTFAEAIALLKANLSGVEKDTKVEEVPDINDELEAQNDPQTATD